MNNSKTTLKKTIKINSEFASELVCVIPYTYWLHERGELEKVITSKGMKPFYYFCDDVEERFEVRTFDVNTNGLQDVPNNWIHHNALAIFGFNLTISCTSSDRISKSSNIDIFTTS